MISSYKVIEKINVFEGYYLSLKELFDALFDKLKGTSHRNACKCENGYLWKIFDSSDIVREVFRGYSPISNAEHYFLFKKDFNENVPIKDFMLCVFVEKDTRKECGII